MGESTGSQPPSETDELRRDCNLQRPSGVRLAIEPSDSATPFYFTNRLPSLTADRTSEDGCGGGFVNVRAQQRGDRPRDGGRKRPSYPPVVVFPRPGAIVLMNLYASPP